MTRPRQALPIDAHVPLLLETFAKHDALVLQAPPGAGKTTRVPLALRPLLAAKKKLILLEPRRIAARNAAIRMSQEHGTPLGSTIGYQVRLERKASDKTQILVVTEGIFLRMLQGDPFLEDVGFVLFDEFHERNLASDLALAMARKVQKEANEDLRIAVMSATIDCEPIAAYLDDCPILRVKGRQYPVTIDYLPHDQEDELPRMSAAGVRQVAATTPDDILVFLPGVREIRKTQELLKPWSQRQEAHLLPLYGAMTSAQQDLVLQPASQRKVILATNVAETSLTIDGVGAVVDSGYARILRHDPSVGLNRLERTRISLASADQRAGRAGRQKPGVCLRLWSTFTHQGLRPSETPEIQRIDLCGAALELLAWGETDLLAFPWFEAPNPEQLQQALALLQDLGALDPRGITTLGKQMTNFPLPPRLARLLLASHQHGCLTDATTLAALLAERNPLLQHDDASLDLLDLLHDATHTLHQPRFSFLRRSQQQLLQRAKQTLTSPAPKEATPHGLRHALLEAFPDRLARQRQSNSHRAQMVGGHGIRLLHNKIPQQPLFLCIDLDAGARKQHAEATVRLLAYLDQELLPPDSLHTDTEVEFDPQSERVIARKRTRFADLILHETTAPTPSSAESSALLAQHAASQLNHALSLDTPQTQQFLARVRLLAETMPELELPAFDEEHLRSLLPSLCLHKRSFDELRKMPLQQALHDTLTYSQQRSLAQHAPERLEVPSGSRIKLQYQDQKPPILAVRIQEMFGLPHTPHIAKGRTPVLLHLLAPNMRPQQVTQDLQSFWQNTYPEVRKELRQRYPKHHWPENPLNATPERRPRRKRPS